MSTRISRSRVVASALFASTCFCGVTFAANTVSFVGGQLYDMLYASDGVTRDGTYDFNITAINPVHYGSVGFFNVAADLDFSGGITSNEWIIQNIPMRLDDGLTSQVGLSAWWDLGGGTLSPTAYTTYATIEDVEIASPGGYLSWYANTAPAVFDTWGALDPNGQTAAAVPAGTSTTGGKTASPKRKGVPDIAQKKNECGPTSAANSLRWLAKQHDFENKLPADNDDLIKALMQAMTGSDARPFPGLVGNQLFNGKVKYIKDNGLPLYVKGGTGDPNAQGGKAFDFIKKELDAGEDVELLIKWPGTGTGSHWVTAVGWAVNGDRLFIEVIDPDDKKDAVVEWELKRDGTFVSPKGAMLWAVSESYPEPASLLAVVGFGGLLLRRARR